MLQNIHDNSKGWIMYIIVGLLVVVFAMWGIGYYLRGSAGPHADAASVNGVKISNFELNKQYQDLRSKFKGALSSQKIAGLKHKAMSQLVENAVLYSAATNMGMGISNQTIDAWITESPAFQVNGHFSQEKFKYALQSMGLSTQMLRSNIRRSVMTSQVQKGISKTAFALPSEVSTYTGLLYEKRVASYAVVPNSDFTSKVSLTSQEIQSYYNAHKKAFYTPRQVKLSYIELSVKGIANTLKVASAQKLADAQTKYSVMGEKLANLTFENPGSLKFTANKLGLPVKTTGFITEKGTASGVTSNAKVLKAAFSDDVLTNGNNSDVINISDTDAVVIRVGQFKKARPKPLSDVKNQVVAILTKIKAAQMAKLEALTLIKNKSLSGQGYTVIATKAYGRSTKDLSIPLLNALFLQPAVAHQPRLTLVKLKNGYAVLDFQKSLTSQGQSENNFNGMLLSGLFASADYNEYIGHLIATAEVKRNA